MTRPSTGPSPAERALLEAAPAATRAPTGAWSSACAAELHAHCYRMLGSVHDAEDALQEALLRAWRGLARLRGPQLAARLALPDRHQRLPRAHRAAAQRGAAARARPAADPHAGPARRWSSGLARAVPGRDRSARGRLAAPEARYEQRESVELAFVAALQHLPARQRAVLILRECSASRPHETAEALDTTAASVNSALQRARKTGRRARARREPAGRRCGRSARSGCASSSRATSTPGSAATSKRSSRCSPRTPSSPCRRCRPGSRAARRRRVPARLRVRGALDGALRDAAGAGCASPRAAGERAAGPRRLRLGPRRRRLPPVRPPGADAARRRIADVTGFVTPAALPAVGLPAELPA